MEIYYGKLKNFSLVYVCLIIFNSISKLGNFIGMDPLPSAPSTVAPEPGNLFAAKLLNNVPQVVDGPSVS